MAIGEDHVYLRLVAAREDPAALVPVFDELAEMADGEEGHWLSQCMDLVAASPSLAAQALTRWLAEVVAIPAARALTHELSVRYLEAHTPAPFDLGAVALPNAVIVPYRLMALYASPAVSLGWMLAVLSRPSDEPTPEIEQLMRFHARQYPYTTRRLLRDVPPELNRRHPFLPVFNAALDAELQALDGAPRLKEFALSTADRVVLQSRRLREDREIHRRSDEASVFTQFVTRRHFKYARNVVFDGERGQGQEQTLTMHEHTLTVELPLLERIDPLGQRKRLERLLAGQVP